MPKIFDWFKERVKNPHSAITKAEMEKKLVDRELAAGSWVGEMFGTDYLDNPAALIELKGLSVIDDMLNDDAIGAFMRMRKEARLATEFNIEPASNDTKDSGVAEFIRWALLEYCETDFRAFLRHQYSAIDYGFSLTEKELTFVDEGKYKGKYAYARLIPQRPHNYLFKLDQGKRLTKDGIVNVHPYGASTPLPAAKFIHYAYNGQWGNPFGQSDVARAYRWWIMKKYVSRFWAIYLERLAGGFITASFDGTVSEKERDNLKNVLNRMSAKTWIMHPEGVTIDVKESSGTGGAIFQNAVNAMNIYMARTVLMPDLLGFSAKPTGSYALGKKHFDVFLWVLDAMGKDMQRIVQEQVIRPLVIMNYGAHIATPRFIFEPLTMGDKIEVLTSFYAAVEKGIFNPVDIPEELREWVLKMLNAPHSERPEQQNIKQENNKNPNIQAVPDTASMGGLKRKLTSYESKVDFASILASFDSLEESTIAQWREIAREQRDSFIGVLRKRKIVEQKDNGGVRILRLAKVGNINKLLRDAFATSYLNARWQAWREVKDAKDDKFSFDTFAADIILEPVPPTEAINHFKDKGLQVTSKDLVPYTQKAFLVAGVEKQKILADCKAAIYEGIRRGDRMWTEGEIKRVFDGYVQTGEIRDGQLSAAYRVENIVRTNMAESYNAGRQSAFNDPDVSDYIEAYQVSAVLDNNTTDFCARMDNRVFNKEEIESYGYPPWHYNCRTIIVPITRGEKYSIDGFPPGMDKKPFGIGAAKPRYAKKGGPKSKVA